MFVRNGDNPCQFTKRERAAMRDRDYSYLLPLYHKRRQKLAAWAVTNRNPRNNREEFVFALSQFIHVSQIFLATFLRGYTNYANEATRVSTALTEDKKGLRTSHAYRKNIPAALVSSFCELMKSLTKGTWAGFIF